MSGNNYYWQGGRKIEIEQGAVAATVQAENIAEVEAAAAASRVTIRKPQLVGSGLVRMEMVDDRDAAMDKLRENHVVHHVYHTKGQPSDEVLITDTFFLKFKPSTTRDEIENYVKAENLQIADTYDDHTYLVRVTNATGKNPIKSANNAAANPIVESAEPNVVRNLQRFSFIPTDPLFSNQWHLHAPNDAFELVAGTDIRAPDAWEITLGSRDVVIAVADDGHDITHPDFQGPDKLGGALNVTPHTNGVDLSFDENVLPQPGDYHGTPCSGVAVAEHNGIGTLGVAPGCKYLPVRFPLALSDAQLARMFERISPLADIVSCSWGYGPANAPMASVLHDKVSELAEHGGKRGKGLVICVAAGNNNCPVKELANTDTYEYRNSFGSISSYSGPIDRWLAAHQDVITVSAITSENKRSAYSSWGNEINVCAPSNNFHDLDIFSVPGRGIWTTDNEGFGEGTDFTSGSRFTGSFGGTSSATPTVAGVCGLVLSRNNTLTARQVRDVIEQTASKDVHIESDTLVNQPGDFNGDGFSLWYGHGRVDAAAAVSQATVLADAEETGRFAATDVPIPVPDTSDPVFSQIEVQHSGTISDFRVKVVMTHTYIGDLRIDLITPNGMSVNLQNHEGGASQNLDRVFGADNVLAIVQLAGQPIAGTWRLRVVDTWNLDAGQIDSWEIIAKLT
ncbi:MAG: S8 family serine peptidase [Pseudomonadota bacterium]